MKNTIHSVSPHKKIWNCHSGTADLAFSPGYAYFRGTLVDCAADRKSPFVGASRNETPVTVKKKLKILEIIVQNRLRSGGGIQMYTLSGELVKRGHQVCALYKEPVGHRGDFSIFDGSGIDLRFMNMGRVKPNLRTLKTVRELRALIVSEGFDIIHAHKGNAVDLCWLATIGLGIPIITNRGVISPQGFFQSLKYRSWKIRRIIAVSQAVKDVMVKTGHIDPAKITVVYGSVDIGEFAPGRRSTIRSELSIPGDAAVIGYIGSALPRKGLPHLFEAFALLRALRKGIVLVLVGVEPADLARFSLTEDLKSAVITAGFRRDVPNCMAGFDVFAFPGIADEGLTGTVREAAAMALPIVTTDIAGNSELIRDHETGLVVPKADSGALAEAIAYLLDNRDTARRFGENARRSVVETMSIKARAERIEGIYYDVLENSV